MTDYPGAHDLVAALRSLQEDYRLDAIAATQLLPGGPLTVRITGLEAPVLSIEDSAGHLVTVPEALP